jgi:hypothetical protein
MTPHQPYDPASHEGGKDVPRYKFRVLRQLRVGKDLRQPGELIPEATDWPNLRSYLSLQWIEQIPVTDDDDPDGVEYPPVSPQSRLARVLTLSGSDLLRWWWPGHASRRRPRPSGAEIAE